MIVALEAVIAYLKTDSDLNLLTAQRVASKHQFGSGWPKPGKAIQVLSVPGSPPELYVPTQSQRLQVRCYGESQYDALLVYNELVRISRDVIRATVETSQGRALIYTLNMASGPSLLRDPETDMDLALVFMVASVAEDDV